MNNRNKRLRSIWNGMKQRCYNPNQNSYNNYGGRGITVCDEWKNSFSAFCDWAISNGYTDNLTLDRINVNKGYAPDNCRWLTIKEQQNNRRNNRFITYKNKTQTVTQWAEEVGIDSGTLRARLNANQSPEKAMCTPTRQLERKKPPLTAIKELRSQANMTRQQFCDYFGIKHRTLQDWELGRSQCQEYILNLITYKLEKEGIINQ